MSGVLLMFALALAIEDPATQCVDFHWGTFSTIEFAKPIHRRQVAGTVELEGTGASEPQYIPEALFQVCGAKTNYRVVAVPTDSRGRFSLSVPPGRYVYVAAKDGYQSVKGTLLYRDGPLAG